VEPTIIQHSVEELRRGVRFLEQGDIESPDHRKVRDELLLAGFIAHDGTVTPAGHRYAAENSSAVDGRRHAA